jgi:homoserine dehydrogenase
MKDKICVGLLGLGTVGTGVIKIIQSDTCNIVAKVGMPIAITKILVRNPDKARGVHTDAVITTDVDDILNDPDIDIVVEVLGGEEPARSYILRALEAGKHVVTANKNVVALYGREFFEAAEKYKVDFLFEASVGGGIPIIRPLKQCLAANRITEVMGIINGTTNFILTKMTKEKLDFAVALAEAQAKGYAEADPTADVGGLDAARKITILASIAFNTRVNLEDVNVEGITQITAQDVDYARELGYVIKLIAIAKETAAGLNVRVHPLFIPKAHPLAAVSDVFNAIYVKGDAIGEAMFYGRGAGEMPTASAVTGDIIDVARDIRHGVSSRILCTCFEEMKNCSIEKTESPYYIRLLVEDKPGVLAAIASAFGAQQVSLHSVIQKPKDDGYAEVVLITYCVPDGNVRMALKTLSGMPIVTNVKNVIRVETEAIDEI